MGIRFITSELDQMDKYLEMVKSLLQEQQNNFLSEKKNFIETSRDTNDLIEMTSEYWREEDEFLKTNYDLLEDFPRRLYSSFIVSLYSFIEDQLLNVCESLGLTATITAKIGDTYGKGIYRARKFMTEIANYRLIEEQWQELLRISKIRNMIVHEGGIIPHALKQEDPKQIQVETGSRKTYYLTIDKAFFDYLQEQYLIDLSGTFYLTPSYNYCKHLIQFGRTLFSTIYHDLAHYHR